MEKNNLIKNRKKGLNKVLIILLVLLPILSIYLLKSDIILILDNKDFKQDNIENKYESYTENEEIIKNNDQERKDNLVEIELILEKYYNENNSYPISENYLKLNNVESEVYKNLVKYSQNETFQDPNNLEFYYSYKSDGSFFELSARLENMNDGSCEMINENVCIYEVKTYGKIVKVLIENENDFFKKIELIDVDQNVIIVTGNYSNENDQKIIDMLNFPKSIKRKKVKEVEKEDEKINNLILIGNADSNDLIFNAYKKGLVVENIDLIDENNLYIASLKNFENPWNDEKKVFIIETGCSSKDIVKMAGRLSVEMNNGYYHLSLNTADDIFSLVSNSAYDNEESFLEYMSKLSGENVEVYGYQKICDFEKIVFQNIISVIGVNKIE